jgi:hypothetical protein
MKRTSPASKSTSMIDACRNSGHRSKSGFSQSTVQKELAHSFLQPDAGGKDHVTLGKELGIMDLESRGQTCGIKKLRPARFRRDIVLVGTPFRPGFPCRTRL